MKSANDGWTSLVSDRACNKLRLREFVRLIIAQYWLDVDDVYANERRQRSPHGHIDAASTLLLLMYIYYIGLLSAKN